MKKKQSLIQIIEWYVGGNLVKRSANGYVLFEVDFDITTYPSMTEKRYYTDNEGLKNFYAKKGSEIPGDF
jgi:hypothetical protein